MIASILAVLQGILQAIPLLSKYFPPATAESESEKIKTTIAEQEKETDAGGLPKWE